MPLKIPTFAPAINLHLHQNNPRNSPTKQMLKKQYPIKKPMRKYDENEFVFGLRAIIETIKSGKDIDKLLLSTDADKDSEIMKELILLLRERGIPYSRVPVQRLDKLTSKNHQGAICFVSAVNFASLDNVVAEVFEQGKVPLILVLDRITDVRNFGAIARTAECAGVHAIVIPTKDAAQLNSDAMKTSAGGLNFVPVCRERNLHSAVMNLQYMGLQVIACSEQTEKFIYQADFTVPTVILLGSEEDGISNDLMKLADMKVKIPMYGKIDSLNVSVSAGVAIYEAIRQRM